MADDLVVTLSDGSEVSARSIVIASGAHYRKLNLERWADFEGNGIYTATELEARACGTNGPQVAVIGGANSAGQAALFLESRVATPARRPRPTISESRCRATSRTASSPTVVSSCT